MSTSITYAKAELTKITGKPTPADIIKLEDEVRDNAASIPNPFGGRTYGQFNGSGGVSSDYQRDGLRVVVSSAAEAELAGLFHNAKEAAALRIALMEMGHAQPPTPLVTDNSTAAGIANDTVKQKQSKAIDMRFYWIRDRVKQKEFCVHWKKGELNRADYFTKDHAATHHQEMRPTYIHVGYMASNYDAKTATYYAMNCQEENHLELFYATFTDKSP